MDDAPTPFSEEAADIAEETAVEAQPALEETTTPQEQAAPVTAEEAPVPEGALQEFVVEYGEHTEAPAPEKAGMPQMDITSFPSQLFWLTVTFVALYVMLARFIMPRIHDVLETRQERITHDIDRADQLQKEAEEAKSIYQKALAEARDDAQQMLSEVTQSIKDTAAEKHAELDAVLKSKLEESGKDIAEAVDGVHERLTPVSAELTAMIVEKLTHHRPSTQEVDAVLGELGREQRAA